MESMNLHHLGMFLDSDIVIVQDEIPALLEKNYNIDLVSDAEAISEEVSEEEHDLIYEGNFEKGILIVYEGSHLEADLREFLFKILGAVNCSLKDIALSSSESVEEVSLAKIDELNANKILIFGKLNHSLFQFKQRDYEIKNENGVEYLYSDDLRSIFSDVALKKSLWNMLQILFGIKK
ncbi:hypothetical protein MM213_01980 [Belliella sp. R4-6]|uniref:Uncharacterized protein n=1 Tax=Belliella alkalica TaxID=1730871 RepID=A0ABS9V741_9BACT|nr:hypothetical protein [Belliella alkalica]MCH7412237.1 hypothetical protein [Belliella alkalica]